MTSCYHTKYTPDFSGNPIESDLTVNRSCWKEDESRRVEEPFSLKSFLDENRENITASNETDLFDHKMYKTDVKLLGHGKGKKCKISKYICIYIYI